MLGEMLSPLVLPGDPTQDSHAVRRKYLTDNYAPLASPTLTGTPAAPTAGAGTNTTQIATTAFVKTAVDAATAGLDWKDEVVAASTADLGATYNNGAGTLTNNGAQAAFATDGISPAQGERILVKNQTAPAENGIYTVTTVGDDTSNWVLTRAADFDLTSQIEKMAIVACKSGTANAAKWFYVSSLGADPPVIGTSAINWSQFTPGTTYSADESSVHLSGTTFSVKDAGISTAKIADGAVTAAKKSTYTAKFGDGAATSFTVTHNRGVENVTVNVKRRSDNKLVGCDVVLTDANTVDLSGFAVAPGNNALEIFIDPVSARAA